MEAPVRAGAEEGGGAFDPSRVTPQLALAKKSRWQVSPSPEQLEAFIAWSRAFRAATGGRFELPTFDELARIAYRHLSAGPED